jgi:hypothetical protein
MESCKKSFMQNCYAFFGLLPGLVGDVREVAVELQKHDGDQYFLGDESKTKFEALQHMTHIATVRITFPDIHSYNFVHL